MDKFVEDNDVSFLGYTPKERDVGVVAGCEHEGCRGVEVRLEILLRLCMTWAVPVEETGTSRAKQFL